MSRFPPNSTRDFHDIVPSSGTGSGDQMPFPKTCRPASRIPCHYTLREFTAFAGSRSRHAGGVHVLFAGGSVRFISDSVDHGGWMAMHSTAGGESR
jgi:prepilin-type processing-associated H-X9-DG protein